MLLRDTSLSPPSTFLRAYRVSGQIVRVGRVPAAERSQGTALQVLDAAVQRTGVAVKVSAQPRLGARLVLPVGHGNGGQSGVEIRLLDELPHLLHPVLFDVDGRGFEDHFVLGHGRSPGPRRKLALVAFNVFRHAHFGCL